MKQLEGVQLKKELLMELEAAEGSSVFCLVLQRVAHFFNEMGSEISPHHRPMMKEIDQFEHLVQHPVDPFGKKIPWDDHHQLEIYCKKLEALMESLSFKNRSVLTMV